VEEGREGFMRWVNVEYMWEIRKQEASTKNEMIKEGRANK
jgi:hypothetical protein